MQPAPASDPVRHPSGRVRLTLLLWGVVAVVSPVSEVVFQIVARALPAWLAWARIAVLVAVFVAGSYWAEARALRHFCIVYGFILAVTSAFAGDSWEFVSQQGFISGMLRVQLLDLCIAAMLIGLIWCLHRRRDRIYLRPGNLAAIFGTAWAPIAGIPLRWRLMGPLIGLGGGVCVLIYVKHAGGAVANPGRALLLWAPLFAAMNSFVEESLSRNGLLSSLEPNFGARQAILATTVIFGIGHWNSLPYGATGVLMTSALGYLAAKAMIETKGMFWSWFMHFIPDWVIFYYWGMGVLQRRDWGG